MYEHGTAHFNLPQTVGTDKRDWLDTNQAFADVDAALYTASETASSTASALSGLSQTVAGVQEDVTDIQEDVTEIGGRVTQQGSAITGLTTRVDDVKADSLDMICAVDEGTAQVATVAVTEGKYFRYNDVLYIATSNINIGDSIIPNTNCRATNVATELEAIESGNAPAAGDTRFDIATGKMQYYNGTTWVNYEGGNTMLPDFSATPLYEVTNTSTFNYTATEECLAYGTIYPTGTSHVQLKINNKPIGDAYPGDSSFTTYSFQGLQLQAGDVLTCSGGSTSGGVCTVYPTL